MTNEKMEDKEMFGVSAERGPNLDDEEIGRRLALAYGIILVAGQRARQAQGTTITSDKTQPLTSTVLMENGGNGSDSDESDV